MQLAQPFEVVFMGSQAQASQTQQHLTQRHPQLQVRFGNSGPQINAPHPVTPYTILVQSTEAIRVIKEALAHQGIPGWVSILTPGGPMWVSLQDFLHQHGLA